MYLGRYKNQIPIFSKDMAMMDLDALKDGMSTFMKWAYWIAGTIVVFMISYVLYTRFDKQVASILVFIASMMALYYYYVKWFIVGQPLPIPAQVCPDFLSNVGSIGAGDTLQTVCVDYTGNYKNFTKAQGTVNVKELISDPASVPADGIVANQSGGNNMGYVVTPNAIGSRAAYWGKLKTAGISHINLCSFA
jgi:hypothetical protein